MKKIWLIFIAGLLIAGTVMLIPHNAKALTEGVLTYTVVPGNAIITDCDESASGALEIPSTLGGYPVVSIDAYAFEGCTGLTSINMPSSINHIGSEAFYNCTNLTSINIPARVTELNEGVFHIARG